MSESLLSEVEAEILAHAGPFRRISDAGRAGLANYLNTVPKDRTRTRAELIEAVEGIRDSFFATLAFVGAFACRYGLDRIERGAKCGERSSSELQHDELRMAEFCTASFATILCPDEPG